MLPLGEENWCLLQYFRPNRNMLSADNLWALMKTATESIKEKRNEYLKSGL
jgi:hypothetical protein